MLTFLIPITALAAIAWVNWYFFLAPKATVSRRDSASKTQEVSIRVEGGYSPSVVRVKNGQALRLVFDRREKAPCSEQIVISDFGIRQFLKPFQKTIIEITPVTAGSYEFGCGMGMLRGRIEVAE